MRCRCGRSFGRVVGGGGDSVGKVGSGFFFSYFLASSFARCSHHSTRCCRAAVGSSACTLCALLFDGFFFFYSYGCASLSVPIQTLIINEIVEAVDTGYFLCVKCERIFVSRSFMVCYSSVLLLSISLFPHCNGVLLSRNSVSVHICRFIVLSLWDCGQFYVSFVW